MHSLPDRYVKRRDSNIQEPRTAPPPLQHPRHPAAMDFINKLAHSEEDKKESKRPEPAQHESFIDKLQASLGGKEPEKRPEPPKEESFMDKLHSSFGKEEKRPEPPQHESFLDKLGSIGKKPEPEPPKPEGFMDKLNALAGGGHKSEQNEDALDKGVDWVQEHVLRKGDQSNESVIEQTKDEKISDFIRDKYKKTTGHDLPVEDKHRKFGH